jgi:hypothetical protein
MTRPEWGVLILALGSFGVALACLVGVILLNWRRRAEPRGFDVTPAQASTSPPDATRAER